MSTAKRTETDILGEVQLPADALYGIHTQRALENFELAGRPVHPELIRAYGTVKLAAAETNAALGVWEDTRKTEAILRACREVEGGEWSEAIRVDALQGGAGTSLNMNVNEVLANRALQILGLEPGNCATVSPTDDINRHQSTNDTYPTALKLALIRSIRRLEPAVVFLQEAFQVKEKEFAHIVKVGRTQMQDAVLTTLGREMSAYAEALTRDRWRIYKCEERLRVINLGGTAIGTGLAAPRQFIFRVVDTLREMTGIGFARAENLIEATQNNDVFVEVSGILKAHASTLIKVANDLRFLSSGPEAGIGEIRLPQRQAGSSVMPGKVNPVIPEAVIQAGMQVLGNDSVVTLAVASGHLELNAFLPIIADNMIVSCDLLTRACIMFRTRCVEGIEADEARCRMFVESSTASATALVGTLGYERVSELVKEAQTSGKKVKTLAIEQGMLTEAEFDACITPEAVCRIGSEKRESRNS